MEDAAVEVQVDDGRVRTGNDKIKSNSDRCSVDHGTFWSAFAHAFTAIVGSGILAIPWSVAQLGWILGPVTLVVFAIITFYTAILLMDCYRVADSGIRNNNYIDAVKTILGIPLPNRTTKKSICHHVKGKDATCTGSGNWYMILYGIMQLILSQFPNLEKAALLSVIAAITSFGYAFIALGLSIAKFASDPRYKGSLKLGMAGGDLSSPVRVWQVFQALGNIAFAYSYSMVLLEIEDTLKTPPSESKTMKRVTISAITTTAFFYIFLGCMGYAAFGNGVPGNILTVSFGPFWIVDIANIAIIVHLVTAYQVFAQPIYAGSEKWLMSRYSTTPFFNKAYSMKFPFTNSTIRCTLCKSLWRMILVIFTTIIAMSIPFFNAILGFLGAMSFWPLTVHFPVSMYMKQAKIKKGSRTWMFLHALSFCCLLVTLAAAIGSVADIVKELKNAKFFRNQL
ncbi:Amino acid permease 8-like protein [Drosera capensis]